MERDHENKRLEQLARQQKKKDVRMVLEEQLREKRKEAERKQKEERDYESSLLDKIR